MPLLRPSIALGILLLVPCITRAATQDGPAPTPAPMLSMLRTTCFGMCPSYRVSLSSDGHFTFDGLANVTTKGPIGGQASPAQIAAIQAALHEADLRSLHDHYTSREDGCAPLLMDMSGVKISIDDAQGSKTVDFYYGCRGAIANQVRPRIDKLADVIDQQLDTARWIGKPTRPGAPGGAAH